MDKLHEFVALSRYAGSRFDLVQAGGGNSSVKLDDGTMLIKGSGVLLSEITCAKGYATVQNSRVLKVLADQELHGLARRERDALVTARVAAAMIGDCTARPSIETLLHSLMRTYTLHTHPLVVNAACCRNDWKELLGSLFPEALLVGYRTPGIELALELKQQLDLRRGDPPEVVFLQNHGLIVSADRFEALEAITEKVVARLEGYFSVDLERYRLVTPLAKLINGSAAGDLLVFLSEDAELMRLITADRALLFVPPFCPDAMVYCGPAPLELRDERDEEGVKSYQDRFHDLPRVLLLRGRLYLVAPNLKKAREAEEVCKFHLMALQMAGKGAASSLPQEELAYLGNWEAEKYRQKL